MRARPLTLLATLFVLYGSFYLCRANLEAAGPLLIATQGFDKTTFGELSAIATFTYAIGKFVMGAAGDSLGGRRLLLVAMAGSIVCSLAFGASTTFAAFVVFAASNRFFQSGGWSAVVKVVSRNFEARRHGTVMGVLSTSYEIGNVLALNVSGLVARWGWRALFLVNPLLFAVVGGGALVALGRETREGPATTSDVRVAEKPEVLGSAERRAALRALFSRGAFWSTVTLSALLTFLRMAFLTWTPTYLYEVSKTAGQPEISGSIVKSSLFPAAGAVAALTLGALSDRLGPGRRAPLMASSLAVVVVLLLVLGHGGVSSTTGAALLIASVGLFLLGPYSLLAGALALDVSAAGGTATATGIIDGAGYLGGTAAGYVLGRLADARGWSAVFDLLTGAAVVAALICSAWSIVALAPPRRSQGATS